MADNWITRMMRDHAKKSEAAEKAGTPRSLLDKVFAAPPTITDNLNTNKRRQPKR